MRLASCRLGEETHVCLVTGHGLLDLTRAASLLGVKDFPLTLEDAIGRWDSADQTLRSLAEKVEARVTGDLLIEPSMARLLPPVSEPRKIMCVFVNYRSHGQEVGKAPDEPVFFFKHSRSLIGDGDDIIVPKFSSMPDHEVELGVIIGKEGKNIGKDTAYNHVAGYTVINDVSFRDGMKRGVEGTVLGRNLFRGKVADTALPMGPWLVTRDEIPEPYPLRISLKVNGETRQEGTTDDMIFKVPELIATASEDNTLLPGDVIATGTCSGVGLYTGKYLQDGDKIEAEVENVGVLRNRVRYQRGA